VLGVSEPEESERLRRLSWGDRGFVNLLLNNARIVTG